MIGSGGDWAPSITTDWLLLDGGGVNTVAVEGGSWIAARICRPKFLASVRVLTSSCTT